MHEFHEGDYTRTTITVPKMLKRRMSLQGQGINWSAVACTAFRAKLDGLKQQRQAEEVKSREEAIERLRKLKKEGTTETGDSAGYQAGQTWAKNRAHPEQLERLENLVESPEFEKMRKARGPKVVRKITATILGLEHHEKPGPNLPNGEMRQKIVKLWEIDVCAPKLPPPANFVIEFVRGATDFWSDVSDQL